MSRIAAAIVRWWWAVIAFWVGLAGVLWLVAPPFAEVATFDNTAFLQPDEPSMVGGRLLEEGWPDDDFSRSLVIAFVRGAGELTDDDRRQVEDTVAWLRSDDAPATVDVVTTHLDDPGLADVFVSDDGQAVFVLASIDVPAFTPPANETVAAVRDGVTQLDDRPSGLDVHVTGPIAVAADQAEGIERSVERTQFLTVGLVLLVLLWVYRSPIAPIVPLVTIGLAYVIALATVSLLAQGGLDVSSLFETFSIVIIFGAGTDYCIFTISRYQEELALAEQRGYVRTTPLRTTTLTATVLVLAAVLGSSAATTIAGFSAQAIAEFGMFRTMGPAMALAVAITLVIGVTLTPALMRLFGDRLFWPASGPRGAAPGDTLLIEEHAGRLELAALARQDDADTATVAT